MNPPDRPAGADAATTPEGGSDTPAPVTEPSVEAGAESKLGAPPGAISTGDKLGGERQRLTQDAAVTEASNDAFWRKSFSRLDYIDTDRGYEYYRPAFRFGWESRSEHDGRTFEDVEGALQERWDPKRAGLDWDEARPAVRDAFRRADNTEASTPGNPLA